MAHYLTSDGKYRGEPFGEDGWPDASTDRFGGCGMKQGRGRAALNQVNRYLQNLVETMANAKLCRTRHRGDGGHNE